MKFNKKIIWCLFFLMELVKKNRIKSRRFLSKSLIVLLTVTYSSQSYAFFNWIDELIVIGYEGASIKEPLYRAIATGAGWAYNDGQNGQCIIDEQTLPYESCFKEGNMDKYYSPPGKLVIGDPTLMEYLSSTSSKSGYIANMECAEIDESFNLIPQPGTLVIPIPSDYADLIDTESGGALCDQVRYDIATFEEVDDYVKKRTAEMIAINSFFFKG